SGARLPASADPISGQAQTGPRHPRSHYQSWSFYLSHKADTCYPRVSLWLLLWRRVTFGREGCGRIFVRPQPLSSARLSEAGIRRGLLECSSGSRRRQRSPVGAQPLDLDLLAADLVVYGLDVIAADLLQRDLLDHPCSLADQNLLGGLSDIYRGVCPVDLAEVFRIVDGAAQNVGMLLVQGHVRRNFTLGDKTAHACLAGFDHALADVQLLFGKTEHLVMHLGQLGRHRDLLYGGNRSCGDRSNDGFHFGGRCDAGGYRAVMDVDRAMDVQDARRVRDLAVRHAHRDDHPTSLERLGVYVSFVFSQPTAEHALPQAGLTQTDPTLVETTDVVGMETACLQRLDSGLGICWSVERCNNGLVIHTIPPGWTDAALRQNRGFPRLLAPPPEGA